MTSQPPSVRVARHPTLIESDYAARLVGFVDRMQHAARHVVAALPVLLRTDGLRLDADDGRGANRVMSRVRAEVTASTNDTAIAGLAAEFAKRTAAHHRLELQRQLEDAKWVNIALMDRRLPLAISQFIHENVALIRRLQGDTLGHLETLLHRGITSGMNADELGLLISERFGVSERHARFIARDQVQKLDSKVTELRHAELGISKFKWWSMEDPRVRPRHKELHGKSFAYTDPPAEGLPGQPVGCRCRQVPILDQPQEDAAPEQEHEVWMAAQRAEQDRARVALQAAVLRGPGRLPRP